jgi:pyruvate dehydrogenase E1 component alpha subunit
MSDPGVTYRTREEIKHVRDYRDPIGLVKHMLIENSWATEKELKSIEKEIRASIEKDVEKLLKDEEPNADDMLTNITCEG